MQLPPPTSRYAARVDYGRYVARRLNRAGRAALAKSARAAADAVLAAGRALEDARFEVQDAIADRDAADDALDNGAKDLRHALASRSRTAVRESPYTDIFPEGIEHYTVAALDDEEARYDELRTRVEAHLPAKEPQRKKSLDALAAGLTAWREAVRALNTARTAESLASTKLANAIDAFNRQMTKTYGALVADLDKPAAERFFPRARAGRVAAEPEGDGKTDEDPAK